MTAVRTYTPGDGTTVVVCGDCDWQATFHSGRQAYSTAKRHVCSPKDAA